MQKGIIQGSTMGWEGQRSFGSMKLAKYFTKIPALPGNHFVMFMNKGKWDGLSPELQKAVMSVSGGYAAEFYGKGDDETGIEVVTQIKEMEGKEIIELSEEEDKKFMELAKPLQEEFLTSIEAKGLPGRKAFDELMKMVKEYKR
jgi:TRAP-type C4-dicarboxylate transport system substrate-binding protein